MNFSTYNIEYEVMSDENYTMVKGQISNETTRNYTLALFKLFLYSREATLAKGIVKLHDFRAGSTKSFETVIDLHRTRIPKIVGYELLFEQGY